MKTQPPPGLPAINPCSCGREPEFHHDSFNIGQYYIQCSIQTGCDLCPTTENYRDRLAAIEAWNSGKTINLGEPDETEKERQ